MRTYNREQAVQNAYEKLLSGVIVLSGTAHAARSGLQLCARFLIQLGRLHHGL